MADLQKGRILSGARAVFALNGVPIGYCSSVQVSESIGYEPVTTLGYIAVLEHVPTSYEVSLSAEQFRLVGETIKSLGFFPKVGQTESDLFMNILTSGDMTATITDRKTNLPLATLTGVRITSHNYTVNARGVVGEAVSFVATIMADESDS